eukprot:m.15800 g.15800  ORF g.15800 m.15800 type:complete len:516 (-) comp5490_c0_seq1:71-1618(-)
MCMGVTPTMFTAMPWRFMAILLFCSSYIDVNAEAKPKKIFIDWTAPHNETIKIQTGTNVVFLWGYSSKGFGNNNNISWIYLEETSWETNNNTELFNLVAEADKVNYNVWNENEERNSSDGRFHSGHATNHGNYTFNLASLPAGTVFNFFCEIHTGMRTQIIVADMEKESEIVLLTPGDSATRLSEHSSPQQVRIMIIASVAFFLVATVMAVYGFRRGAAMTPATPQKLTSRGRTNSHSVEFKRARKATGLFAEPCNVEEISMDFQGLSKTHAEVEVDLHASTLEQWRESPKKSLDQISPSSFKTSPDGNTTQTGGRSSPVLYSGMADEDEEDSFHKEDSQIILARALLSRTPEAHETDGALVFQKGDVIRVTSKLDHGLWEGQLEGGETGHFPFTLVEIIQESSQSASEISLKDAPYSKPSRKNPLHAENQSPTRMARKNPLFSGSTPEVEDRNKKLRVNGGTLVRVSPTFSPDPIETENKDRISPTKQLRHKRHSDGARSPYLPTTVRRPSHPK